MRTFMEMTDPVAPPTSPYLMALGGANMDIAATAAHPLTPGESMPGRVRSTPGGVARNVAQNLAQLGHRVHLLSVVGDDALGQGLLDATRRAGVDVAGCLVLPGRVSSSYLSLFGTDGELALAVNDMEILGELTPERLDRFREPLRAAAALVLDCNLSPAALQWLFGQALTQPVFADAVSAIKAPRLLPWLARIHTLKVNRAEAAALWGRPVESLDEVRAAAAWFIGQGLSTLVLTMGAQGVYWLSAHGASGLAPVFPVKVVNTSGAGDALLAALLHSHLAGEALAQAMPFACACAAMTLQSESANHPGLSVAALRSLMAGAATQRLAAKSGA
jgi:pseudouridine kinase